ncbi:MAG: hypothetical protein HQL72_07700 [Magnetococcales bacterium]|nr:hypothetical protein [Magnetococcales bacterium]
MADEVTLQTSQQNPLTDQLKELFVPQITQSARDGIQEMVRVLLPVLAEKIVREEIQTIYQAEQSVEIDPEQLRAAIQQAFTPQVESIAREMVQDQVARMLPSLAEKKVLEEIERVKSGRDLTEPSG